MSSYFPGLPYSEEIIDWHEIYEECTKPKSVRSDYYYDDYNWWGERDLGVSFCIRCRSNNHGGHYCWKCQLYLENYKVKNQKRGEHYEFETEKVIPKKVRLEHKSKSMKCVSRRYKRHLKKLTMKKRRKECKMSRRKINPSMV